MGIPIPVFRKDDEAAASPSGTQGSLEPCRFGRYSRRLERNPFRQIDDLLPDFLGLDHATPAELDGLYLALRGWPTPGRAAAPLNLRREVASVVWTQGVAEGTAAEREGSAASMPELLDTSGSDSDDNDHWARWELVTAAATAAREAAGAAGAPWPSAPTGASTTSRGRQRQAPMRLSAEAEHWAARYRQASRGRRNAFSNLAGGTTANRTELWMALRRALLRSSAEGQTSRSSAAAGAAGQRSGTGPAGDAGGPRAEGRPAGNRLASLEWWTASGGPSEADYRNVGRPAEGEAGGGAGGGSL